MLRWCTLLAIPRTSSYRISITIDYSPLWNAALIWTNLPNISWKTNVIDVKWSNHMIVFVTETLAVYYSPFFAHILEGWARKDDANVLFLFYEDMKRVNWILQFLKDNVIGLFCIDEIRICVEKWIKCALFWTKLHRKSRCRCCWSICTSIAWPTTDLSTKKG